MRRMIGALMLVALAGWMLRVRLDGSHLIALSSLALIMLCGYIALAMYYLVGSKR